MIYLVTISLIENVVVATIISLRFITYIVYNKLNVLEVVGDVRTVSEFPLSQEYLVLGHPGEREFYKFTRWMDRRTG